jgi:hypothetical protein
MKKLALTLVALVTAILSTPNKSEAQTPSYGVYLSGGLPSVSINSNTTLTPGQSTPLSDLITLTVPTDTQCTFYSYPSGAGPIGTGPCGWGYIAISLPTSSIISGGYPNQGYSEGLLYATVSPSFPPLGVVLPPYSDIIVTPSADATGSISLSGAIDPATVSSSSNLYFYGGIPWGGPPIPISCATTASAASSPVASFAATSLVSADAGSCNPPPLPQCQSDVMPSLHVYPCGSTAPVTEGSNQKIPITMCASFRPKVGLQQAQNDCGVDKFDWQQKVTHQSDPSMFWARNEGGAFDANVIGEVNLSSDRTPYSDPPAGGGTDCIRCNPPNHSYPFFYDVTTDLPLHTNGNANITFSDTPSDGCLPGGEYADNTN